jgi:hypothetical protein
VKRLWAYTGVPVIFPLLVLYGLISYFTWFKHPSMANFGFNPYEYLNPSNPIRSIFSYHLDSFSWMRSSRAILILLTAFSPVFATRLARNHPSARNLFFASSLLFWICLGATGIICWQSLRKLYWLLPRQWVGSSFGIDLAVCLSLQALVDATREKWRWVPYLPWVFFGTTGSLTGVHAWKIQVQNRADIAAKEALAEEARAVGPEIRNSLPEVLDPAKAVELAKLNLADGGPVWPVFARFYGKMVPLPSDRKDHP